MKESTVHATMGYSPVDMEDTMILTERYKERIAGVLSCFDRIIVQGTLPGWCFDKGMTEFLFLNKIRIFDYPQFAQTLRERIRENAERIAKDHGIEIEFIRKIYAFRKADRIQEILKTRGTHQPGLVHIFSAMETCISVIVAVVMREKGLGRGRLITVNML